MRLPSYPLTGNCSGIGEDCQSEVLIASFDIIRAVIRCGHLFYSSAFAAALRKNAALFSKLPCIILEPVATYQPLIAGRVDHVEAKIQGLVGMSVSAEFHDIVGRIMIVTFTNNDSPSASPQSAPHSQRRP